MFTYGPKDLKIKILNVGRHLGVNFGFLFFVHVGGHFNYLNILSSLVVEVPD